jgi:hypothetical protein
MLLWYERAEQGEIDNMQSTVAELRTNIRPVKNRPDC